MKKYNLTSVIIIGILFVIYGGCNKQNTPSGGELIIRSKAGIDETIFVTVVSGKHQEDFGGTGDVSDKKDGLAGIGFSQFRLDKKAKVICSYGEEENAQDITHEHVFDVSEYLPYAQKIRSMEFVYHGKKRWEFKAYDNPLGQNPRNEILAGVKNF